MTEGKAFTVAEVNQRIGGRLIGDGSVLINRVASLEAAGRGDIAFVEEEKFFADAETSNASCLIVPAGAAINLPCRIEVAKPKLAFALAAEVLHAKTKREPEVHQTAAIASNADIDLTVFVGAHVTVGEHTRIKAGSEIHAGASIGNNVEIGFHCVLHPNVVIYDNVTLGDGVILHAGVIVGADGFGYVREGQTHHKFPQIGTVIIEDEVEIGANTCIDRGALGQTRIGRGTKIDNLVHVGHNVDIGERVIIAAQTGISGSVTIEDDVIIGGQVGFGDHIRVQSGAVIGSKAGILPGKIVRPGMWWGIPIQPLDEYKRMNAHLGRLPQMRDELKDLRERLKRLEGEKPSS
jgi:UDP-3-O-[3-hydroxymyristoyl] glucosamine N-acyltransferase